MFLQFDRDVIFSWFQEGWVPVFLEFGEPFAIFNLQQQSRRQQNEEMIITLRANSRKYQTKSPIRRKAKTIYQEFVVALGLIICNFSVPRQTSNFTRVEPNANKR